MSKIPWFTDALYKDVMIWYEWNPWLTAEERGAKALEDISKKLDKHQESLESSNTSRMSGSWYREPQYIPPPEVYIDTDKLADAQYEISDRISWVLDAQRDIVKATMWNNVLQKRLISGQ